MGEDMIKVGIIGVSGYTGVELARILSNCPNVDLKVVTSRQYDGQPLSTVFPSLKNITDIICENLSVSDLVKRADFFFTAVPHKTAMAIVPDLLEAGKKVVDLSADFRLNDAGTYEKWYQPHTAKKYLNEAVYGLPEIYRNSIKNARLVANPGCYPTSVILGLAPLLKAGKINPSTIVVDSKSGASGAGRAANTATLFCEVSEGFKAYNVGVHRHTPEMEQEINKLCGSEVNVSFTPHLLPMSRGILSTIYATLDQPAGDDEIHGLYSDFYKNDFFVRLNDIGFYPATQFVRGSNFCDIGIKTDSRTNRVVVLSAIDNIVKGAAGQAVQNMNLMCGLNETQGLEAIALFP